MPAPLAFVRQPVALAVTLFAASVQAQTAAPAADLAPVVISGRGFEQRAFDTPYSVDIVDADTLAKGGLLVNLSETLARVPGLTVANRSNYAQDLQINSRGFGARSSFGVRGIRLYTDGIPASMPDGSGQVSHFDLAGAQRIEVLRGPFSALYGNSSGGVISLFSAPVRERYLQLDGDVGDDGTRQVRATLQTPLSDTPGRGFDLRASVSKFETDGFRPQSQAERTLANVRLGWTGAQDTVAVQLNHIDQPADDPLGLTRAAFDADPYQTATVALPQDAPGQAGRFNTRKTVKQTQIGASWRHRFEAAGPLQESAVTAYTGTREVRQFQSIPPATQAAATSPGGVIDFERDYFGLDARLAFRWTLAGERRASLVVGAAHESAEDDRRGFRNFIGTGATQQLGVLGELRRDETNRVTTTDVYAQGELELSARWSATFGLRSGEVKFRSRDRYIVPGNGDDSGSTSDRYTNPVAALQFRATPTLNLYLSAGQGFESPTLNELAYRSSGSGFNSELKAQESTQVELGAKWRPAGTGLSVDAALFSAKTENEIGVLSNTGGRSVFQNVGDTTRRGAEVAAAWQISRALRSTLALTWLHATYDDSVGSVVAGNRIAGTSPRSAFAELAWRPLASERTELATEVLFRDKVAVNDANSDFAGAWSTVAVRAQHIIPLAGRSRVELLARVDNLFGREYAGSVIVNEGNSRFFEPGAPRTWLLSAKWRHAF
ncbi:TonB-dependent receptor family protein [Aquariibacter albus]|uniref:TonB-dependent receptor n=1 Tax=Aquariibacter albus TaxID=2759899 RepID=A0A839HSS6_9BURK|nr:TonB-dependent receptor [Aquariibacter albus]MBB1162570.1 TonB-dependent receptor [Aquariibacter albus]